MWREKELNIQANGVRISRMVLGEKNGRMGQFLLEISQWDRSKEKGDLNLEMAAFIKAISFAINSTVKGLIHGQMEINMKETGRIIKWMVKDSSRGLMVDSLKELISTENVKEEESLFGQIKKSMMVFGRKDYNMERVFIVIRNRLKGMVLGIWGSL